MINIRRAGWDPKVNTPAHELSSAPMTLNCPSTSDGSAVSINHYLQGLNCLRRSEDSQYPFAEDRLPESLHFAEFDVIVGVVRGRSVHKVGYGHNCDWAAA